MHREQGVEAATTVVRRRAGGHFDPELADAFVRDASEILADVEADAALAAEPAPHARFEPDELPRFARAFADFVDLKSPWTVGHSPGGRRRSRASSCPALLHDLGRVAVPNGIWDKPGPLTAAERERVRLHPYYTERILARTPAFAAVAEVAAADHERLDGTGYHAATARRRTQAATMRLLAAADVYAR